MNEDPYGNILCYIPLLLDTYFKKYIQWKLGFLHLTLAVQVLTWAKQHEQRLETALTEVLNNANLLEELLSWLQWAETTLIQRDTEPLPQDIPELKTLVTEHQVGFLVTDNGDTHHN